jgi:orotate phosphoribosyltransferase
MLSIQDDFQKIVDNPSKLDGIGEVITRISHEITDETDYNFFVALVGMLIGENILQNVVEDDSIPSRSIDQLNQSISQYAQCITSLTSDNGFKQHATEFGRAYRNVLLAKKRPEIKEGNFFRYYEGTEDRPVFIKTTGDKDARFLDVDLIFSGTEASRKFMAAFVQLIAKAITKHKVTKLCFVEKRKGPLGTLLMLSEVVNRTGVPAFIYRADYMEKIGRIKGSPPLKGENIGIIYDAAFSGAGLEEVIEYIHQSFESKVCFAAVAIEYDAGANSRLLNNTGVELISLVEMNNIDNFDVNNAGFSKNECSGTFERSMNALREEVYLKLSYPDEVHGLIKVLLNNKIPHASYYGDIFATSIADKSRLEELGFKFEIVSLMNLSNLSLAERNALKGESRSHWLSTRDSAISELLSKYGAEQCK